MILAQIDKFFDIGKVLVRAFKAQMELGGYVIRILRCVIYSVGSSKDANYT